MSNNEYTPTPEQIEAAALPIFEAHAGFAFADDLRGSRAWSHALETAEVALVAAAGVTPQERECQCYGADGVTDQKCPVCAAPVQVDEAKLAEEIAKSYANGQGLKIRDDLRTARAVVEWLRGGGQ